MNSFIPFIGVGELVSRVSPFPVLRSPFLMGAFPSERPLIIPIYLSSPAFNLASMTSYDTYSFLRHIRSTAWNPERGGSIRDGIAETCWYLSQNTANIALLLPRAGLCLALLFNFSSSQPGTLALADSGSFRRDRTFFNPGDGTLSSYAEGVLISNAAWTAWRTLVWLCAWYARYIRSLFGDRQSADLDPQIGLVCGSLVDMAAPVFVVPVLDGRKRRRRREPLYTVLKTSTRQTPCLGHGVMVPAVELWKPTIFARRTSQIKPERGCFQISRKPRFPSRAWSRFWLLLACLPRLNLPEGVP